MAVTVRDVWESLQEEELSIRLVAGTAGLDKEIPVQEINRPGLALAGFYDSFASDRIQIFGQGESAFVHGMDHKQLADVGERFFAYDLNTLIFSHNIQPPELFFEYAEKKSVPMFVDEESTSRLMKILVGVLEEKFAPHVSVHGVLIEVFGVGVVLRGHSGIGKSETALELVERGHRLVADDLIYIKSYQQHNLVGSGTTDLRHYMEIRGLGIINIKEIFGAGAVRDSKRIDLTVTLTEWDTEEEYDRLGLEEKKADILGNPIHEVIIPVKPGRNIPIIIETAAMDHRLRRMGYNSAKEANNLLQTSINRNRVRNKG